MLDLKGCPRCHGDLYSDRDAHGAFRQCLQCGFIQDLVEAPYADNHAVPAAVRQTETRLGTGLEKAIA